MLVIDCSITMAWLFEDEKTTKTENLLNDIATKTSALVPALWMWEVINTLLVGERRNRLSSAQSMHFLETLKSLDIQVDQHASLAYSDATLNIARNYQLSAYDAAYLNLAIRHDIPLATLDKQLLAAAKAWGAKTY